MCSKIKDKIDQGGSMKILLFVLLGILLFGCVVPSSNEQQWRCDKWHFEGTMQNESVSFNMTEGQVWGMMGACTINPAVCDIWFDGVGGFNFDNITKIHVKQGNDTLDADIKDDCVEWIGVKVKI